MIFRVEMASWRYPFWWMDDDYGFRHVMPVAICRTTQANRNAVAWSLYVGPLCLRMAYRKASKPASAGEG